MDYVFLGRTGVRVSQLVMGTMPFGGDADEATSRALFGRARDAGINTFDCADVYTKGRAEEILGACIAEARCRDTTVVMTKAYFPMGRGPNERGASRYHLVRAVEASLRRLGTDRIDVLFLHRFDDATALDETLRGLEDLIRRGKVLYGAASNYAAWQTMKALGVADRSGWSRMVALQPMYNLAKRQAEVELLPMAASEELAVFPYSPLGGGLLTGKYGSVKRPASGRLVDNPMYQTRYGDPDYYALAERFTALAAELGHSPVALAIAWVASHPAVTAPLVGARNLAQLEAALEAVDVDLDAETRDRISALSPSPPPATDRNEERSANNYGTR